MPKICDMDTVRGGEPGFPIELWRDDETNRLTVRIPVACDTPYARVDVGDLIAALRTAGLDEELGIYYEASGFQ